MNAVAAWLALAWALTSPPAQVQDPGARAFQRCAACHALTGGEDLAGPPLGGVVGRRAASRPGFVYSGALTQAGRAGLTWDAATLERFIADPEAVVPGTSMPYVGGPASERRAVVAWLARRR